MFSGIIRTQGVVESIVPKGSGFLLSVHSPELAPTVGLGDSVAHSGVCLTVVAHTAEALTCEVMATTLDKTTLGSKKPGDNLNLETSLRVGNEVGGHFVYGHVDGVAAVTAAQKVGDSLLLTFIPPKSLMAYIAPQGSVAIDGVSLTIAEATDTTFAVSLIDYTQAHTTLGVLGIGDTVNVECDMLAKYVAVQLERLKVKD